jgi:tRNA A37 threonylcarbamoyladenosine modification protein TsaB
VPAVLAPAELAVGAGTLCVGDGARRYRALLEEKGAVIPPDDDERHLPRARFHVQLMRELVPVEQIEPLYLRVPDAERSVA